MIVSGDNHVFWKYAQFLFQEFRRVFFDFDALGEGVVEVLGRRVSGQHVVFFVSPIAVFASVFAADVGVCGILVPEPSSVNVFVDVDDLFCSVWDRYYRHLFHVSQRLLNFGVRGEKIFV